MQISSINDCAEIKCQTGMLGGVHFFTKHGKLKARFIAW
jgi:hypothetical protein